MPPTDSTPNVDMGVFELSYSTLAYDKIPVSEYRSRNTGLTVVLAEVEGPVVNGFFCVVTEAFDDDGLPHTLEHLIFLGSEDFPYKGVLDIVANRCLASGTNAWTDIDHTCYTMETAGSEGFLALMPIYLDHILYPCLTDEGFITEVHHINEVGEDGGVVYCEIQGRENCAESRIHLTMAREMYPGKCGYSSDTGGVMKNLRDSTTNEKVRNYHKEFYRPENLKLIIVGQVKTEDVFRALGPIEKKILSKGERGPFQRPWQSPVAPLPASKDLVIKYPSDDESSGIFTAAWRGPSSVTDVYTATTSFMLLKYLTQTSVSPLQKEFVEISDPYASKVSCHMYENSESCLYLMFKNVPKDKLSQIRAKLLELLRNILEKEDIDMKRMTSIINRRKLECLSEVENGPHHTIAFSIIGHMLYGNTKSDLEQRINPLTDLEKMLKEPKSYWLSLLKRYFIDGKLLTLEAHASIEEQQRLATDEKQRIEEQIKRLGEEGLKQKEIELEAAVDYNERPPPNSMLTCLPIPSLESISFHNIVRYRTDLEERQQIDLSKTPVYTYFDHIKSGFVYIFALMDTTDLVPEQRLYLPLLLEALFESPINRNGKIIPYEDIVAELSDDTVGSCGNIGVSSGKRSYFSCGGFAQTCTALLQVESAKFEKGVQWMREILYKTVFTKERIQVIAQKIINEVAQAKRSGKGVVTYAMEGLRYSNESNQRSSGMLKQQKFLTQLLQKLNEDAESVISSLNKIRNTITNPSNLALHFAGNLEILSETAVNAINDFLPDELKNQKKQKSAVVTPDWKLMVPPSDGGANLWIIGMGCLESSFLYQTTPSINSQNDTDLPALLVYVQYLIQAEGPLWKQIRGKGFSYGYTILLKSNEALLYLAFSRATNVFGAYKESKELVEQQLKLKNWDITLLESAKSSLIYEIIEEEKNIGNVVSLSLLSYFQGVDFKFNRRLLGLIEKVTVDDLNRVGEKYMSSLFDPCRARAAIATDSAKAEEIAEDFRTLGLKVTVYPTLEESFLNDI